MTPHLTQLKERYIIHEVMSRDESSAVYRAFDIVTKRDVVLRTIMGGDGADATATRMLGVRSVLARLADPVIVNLDDIGELEEGGKARRFFTTPLFDGVSLSRLVREGKARPLTISSAVRILTQACRSLHRAHEQGLAHGGLKPGNIFVLDDKAVRVLNFGINVSGLDFAAPEQLEGQPASPLADQFSMGGVAFFALTRRNPFPFAIESELAEAIRKHNPAPACDSNPKVGVAISQVLRKAMAKRPEFRYANLLEFSAALRKATRRQPLPEPDLGRIRPRMQRAALCYQSGEAALASEIVAEVESEGFLDEQILDLRKRIDATLRQQRQRDVIGTARFLLELGKHEEALGKAKQAVDIDPEHGEAHALKNHIEAESLKKQHQQWIAQARQHLADTAPKPAREVLDNVLRSDPGNAEAQRLSAEIEAFERKLDSDAAEKARLYEASVAAWKAGDIEAALAQVSLLEAMERDLPDGKRDASYHVFHHRVRSEHDALNRAYEEVRAKLAAGNVGEALQQSERALGRYPTHSGFLALKAEAETRQREQRAALAAAISSLAEQEPDLERRVRIFEQALESNPGDAFLQICVRETREKRDLIASLIAKARVLEEQTQFAEALDRWQIVGSLHERQPGLAAEISRLIKRRDKKARRGARDRWMEQARQLLMVNDYAGARLVLDAALIEFPGDSQLTALDQLLRAELERAAPLAAPPGVPRRRMIGSAAAVPDAAPTAAPALPQSVDPAFIAWCLNQAGRLHSSGDREGAAAIVSRGLAVSPRDPALLALEAELRQQRTRPAQPPASTVLERLPAKHYPIPVPPQRPPGAPPPPPAAAAATAGARPAKFWKTVSSRLRRPKA